MQAPSFSFSGPKPKASYSDLIAVRVLSRRLKQRPPEVPSNLNYPMMTLLAIVGTLLLILSHLNPSAGSSWHVLLPPTP